ncbi:hypothetical protein GQ55_5G395400 [Panicum hallii var. hallii]|uniref:Uncharacterized protein n=1 Tax=Panicum hallii var. hallii TaxID=1504633 RepID=A0A2T7DN74_9POAL|nr:hypothetical protein GQ55_5G395400 [Panicum hallii var. hallii]
MARAGYGPLVIRAVDRAGLRSIRVWEHMRAASRKLEWMRATRRNEAHVSVYGFAEDKALLARCKARPKELGLAAVDHAMEMVLKVVRHIVVKRQD